MKRMREGALELRIPEGVHAERMDDEKAHGLSHCMKAVDFVVEEQDRVLFIEFKDPDHPHAKNKDRKKFEEFLQSGGLVSDLVGKYRDSFLYRWAEGKGVERVVYCVLIAMERLEKAQLLAMTDELKRRLPVQGPKRWRRQIAVDAKVFNLASWNTYFARYPVTRIQPKE